MFEYDQDIVEMLITGNDDFRRLYEKHGELKQRVRDGNLGAEPIDDFELENMKKEKLLLKDQMANMIESYRVEHA